MRRDGSDRVAARPPVAPSVIGDDPASFGKGVGRSAPCGCGRAAGVDQQDGDALALLLVVEIASRGGDPLIIRVHAAAGEGSPAVFVLEGLPGVGRLASTDLRTAPAVLAADAGGPAGLLGSFCQRRRYPAFQPWPGPVRSDLVSLPG
ncbi:hypothetical protein B4Q13_21170 [Lacticaseibacillus rhamnosus]